MAFEDNKTWVFISYAREDEKYAKKLHKSLKTAGLNPWLDTEEILPGVPWKIAIRKGIQSSKYFIALLSSNSVEKKGYVKKELKQALSIFEEMSPTQIFIVPVKLDNCKTSNRVINSRHIEDLSKNWNQGISRILLSMGVSEDRNDQIDHQDPLVEKQVSDLTNFLYRRNCLPIIGEIINSKWIPSNEEISSKWSNTYDYPMNDVDILPRVSQFLAVKNENAISPKESLSKILKGIPVPDFSISENQDSSYAILSSFDLPVYITTNYDHFMEAALKSRGKEPVSDFYRWSENLAAYAKNADLPDVFDPEKNYTPSSAKPLVYHLHGDMETPQSMVLTEKDYFDFFINLGNKATMLPGLIRKKLITIPLLIIGFEFDNLYTRLTFECLFRNLSILGMSNTMALSPIVGDQNHEEAERYFGRYLQSEFNSSIIWQDYVTFLIMLKNRINKLRQNYNLK